MAPILMGYLAHILPVPLSLPDVLVTTNIINYFVWKNNFIPHKTWAFVLASVCLLIYVFSWNILNDFADSFSAILVLYSIYYIIKTRFLSWKDPIILLLIAALAVQLISWCLAISNHPEWADNSAKLHRMGVWFKMIPVALLLGGRTRNVTTCWLLALGSIVMAPWISGNGWDEWQKAFNGGRVGFGIINAQHMGMLSAIFLLSLIAASTAVHGLKGSVQRAVLYGLILAGIILTTLLVIVTQTRGVWIGLAMGLLFLLPSAGLIIAAQSRKKFVAGCMFLVVLTFGCADYFQDVFEARIQLIKDEFSSAALNIKKNNDSVGIRVLTWRESLVWLKQRPVWGWGGNIEKHIAINTKGISKLGKHFRHLHNSYLETLINYGFVGLLLLAVLYGYLIYSAIKSWRAKVMPTPVFIFLASFTPFWLCVNMFESFIYYSDGEYVIALIGGVVLSYSWRLRGKQQPIEAGLAS